VVAGGDFIGILDGAEQLEAYRPPALPAKRKSVSGKQRGFMHQAMCVMGYAINAAFWNQLPGPMSFQNRLPLPTFYPKREHDILKSSNLAGKPSGSIVPAKNQAAGTHVPFDLRI